MTRVTSNGASLARRADAIVMDVSRKHYATLTRSINRLQSEATESAATEREARNIRRRIADLRLMVAVLKKRSPSECAVFLASRAALGYQGLYRESLNVGMFARYCLKKRARKIGQTVLSHFLVKLDRAVQKHKEIPTALSSELRRLLKDLGGPLA